MKKSIIVMVIFIFLITGAAVLAQKSATIANFFTGTRYLTGTNSELPEPDNQLTSLKNNIEIKQSSAGVETSVLNSQTPDYIFYDMFFNMVKSFDNASARRETNGGSGKIWKNHIKNKIGFSDQQMDIVRNVADDFFNAVKPVHLQAMQIIKQRRAAHSNQKPPFTPSQELQALQLQRNTIASTYGSRLQTLLGSPAIAQLRQSMQQTSVDSQYVSDADRQLLREQARHLRNNRSNSNQRGDGNE